MRVMTKNKLIAGFGVNDADYNVYRYSKLDGKLEWACPYYISWKGMVVRCYSEKALNKRPNYRGCSVCDDWVYFSNFKAWMEQQDWEGKQLDKDILIPKNKVYSPETCVFVDQKVNAFITENKKNKGKCPVGVNYTKNMATLNYRAECWSVVEKVNKKIGCFATPEEAHLAWLAFKLEQAYILAAGQTDERVAKALVYRYENYGQLFTEEAA